MDLIAALSAFLRVAETGSFSVVAGERGLTQPAISRQISALEAHLGTRLVQRSTSGVVLTDEGRNLIPAAHELIGSAELLSSAVTRGHAKPVGRVRVSVPGSLGLHICARIGTLLDQHPELLIDMVVKDSTSDLIGEGLDLEVRLGPISDSSLISRRVGMTSAFLVASPEYLEGRPWPEHPRDLLQHNCIVYSRWGKDDIWWFSGPEAPLSIGVPCRLRANSAEAVHRAALAGSGVAILSHLSVADDIREGRLVTLLPAFPPLRFPLYVVYPSRRNLPLRTQVVIEFIAGLLRDDPFMNDGR